ncbi:hypothetical protein D3C78_1230710 [compost metagenome]
MLATRLELQKIDDLARHILAGGGFDPLQTRGGVHLQYQGATGTAQDIHPGHVQPHDLGGLHRCRPLFRGDLDGRRLAATVQVGAKLPRLGLTTHGRHHLATHHHAANVGAIGLADVLLHQDVVVGLDEGLDHALGRLLGLAQHHAYPLGPLQQFHHQRRPADHGDEVGHVVGAVGIAGDGQAYAVAGEQLHGAQLVPGATDGHRAVEGHGIHHLELAQHGGAIEGDAGTDARDHGVIALQFPSFVVDGGAVGGDVHVAAQGVEHLDLMPARLRHLDQTAGGVVVGLAG